MPYGTCSKCGCTDDNACTHPDHGNCWWIDENCNFCSHCFVEEIAGDPQTKHPVKECKISNSTCVYHACMSDDCQKNVVISNGQNWGPGKCEITKNTGKEAETK